MTTQDYINLISVTPGILFAGIALFFTWRVYKRENTINNENFVYQKKYDAYEKLFSLGVEYVTAAENVRAWLKIMQKKKTEFNEEEFEKSEERFEAIEDSLELEFMRTTMVLPENVLDAFSDLIYIMEPWNDSENLETWKKNIDFYYKQLDKIHILITKDLHLKVLNDGIFGRLNKEKKKRPNNLN